MPTLHAIIPVALPVRVVVIDLSRSGEIVNSSDRQDQVALEDRRVRPATAAPFDSISQGDRVSMVSFGLIVTFDREGHVTIVRQSVPVTFAPPGHHTYTRHRDDRTTVPDDMNSEQTRHIISTVPHVVIVLQCALIRR